MIFLMTDWLTLPVFTLARFAAAIGGAIVGYFLCGPLARGIFRIAFHRPTPRLFVFWGKVLGGVLIGFLCYFFLPIGGGGGWGWGPGSGGGPGKGSGDGNNTEVKDPKDKKVIDKETVKPVNIQTSVNILLLGPKHKVSSEKYYVIEGAAPIDLDAVKTRLSTKDKQVIVTIQLNDDSVRDTHPAVTRLVRLLNEMGIAHKGPIDVTTPAPK